MQFTRLFSHSSSLLFYGGNIPSLASLLLWSLRGLRGGRDTPPPSLSLFSVFFQLDLNRCLHFLSCRVSPLSLQSIHMVIFLIHWSFFPLFRFHCTIITMSAGCAEIVRYERDRTIQKINFEKTYLKCVFQVDPPPVHWKLDGDRCRLCRGSYFFCVRLAPSALLTFNNFNHFRLSSETHSKAFHFLNDLSIPFSFILWCRLGKISVKIKSFWPIESFQMFLDFVHASPTENERQLYDMSEQVRIVEINARYQFKFSPTMRTKTWSLISSDNLSRKRSAGWSLVVWRWTKGSCSSGTLQLCTLLFSPALNDVSEWTAQIM